MTEAPSACFQCGLPAPLALRAEINGAERLFCCKGCKLAAELIHGQGLDSFYAKREGFGLQPKAKSEFPFDDPNFETSILTACGLKREVVLTLDGLHCAACVWLIERVLGRTPGVVEARVNFTARRLHLTWDPSETKLVALTNLLSSLGYPPSPYDPTGSDRKARALNRDMLMRLGVGGLALTAAMFLGDPLNRGGFDATELHLRMLLTWTALILTTPAAMYVGWPFYRGAWTGLKAKAITMDLTITVAALLAYVTSVWTILTGAGPIYFDCLMTMLFLLLLGRQIEGAAKRKVFSQAERHWRLEAPTATLLEEDQEKSIPTASIRAGDRLFVRPGDKVPVDGVILSGEGLLDEQMLTGESLPVSKAPGDAVTAGTLNFDGALVIQAERIGAETTLAAIVRWVTEADASRSPSQHFADRLSTFFLPTLLLISALTYWLNMPLGVNEALNRTISVLIVTCPCALGLAIPAAVAVAMSRGARDGILFKGGDQLEGLHAIKRLVFDKTGTLTTGQMKVLRLLPALGQDEARVLELAASLEAMSEHPIAQAIAAEGKVRNLSVRPVQGFKAIPGRGVEGVVDDEALRIGTLEWLGLELPENWREPDITATTVYVACENELLGAIAVADSLRRDAADTVQELKRRGIELTLLSGDRTPVVQQLAYDLGMAYQAEVRPDAKRDVLMAMQQQGPVAMVGDGVNDAPALAIASIGIAMGRGAAISASAAGVVLLGDRLEQLLEAFKLSERTVQMIRSNLMVSAIYNVIVIPIAALGLIPPQLAAFLMPMSSLLVLGNSLRLSK